MRISRWPGVDADRSQRVGQFLAVTLHRLGADPEAVAYRLAVQRYDDRDVAARGGLLESLLSARLGLDVVIGDTHAAVLCGGRMVVEVELPAPVAGFVADLDAGVWPHLLPLAVAS